MAAAAAAPGAQRRGSQTWEEAHLQRIYAMFTFETARLDGGGEFTRKEKLFKRFSLGDLPGAGGRSPAGGEGRPLPGAGGAGT